MEIQKIIGSTLREKRLEKGLTAEFMTKKLKICLGAYLNYEKGRTFMKAVHLYKCSKILEIPVEDLFENLE